MKLTKTLISAIVIGVAVQVSSCSKDKDEAKPSTENEKSGTKVPQGCPGCGMG
jgi:hypothetical protein